MKTAYALVFICLVLCGLRADAQSVWDKPEQLKKEIAQMDSLLFDAFNNCDIERLGSMHASDLEFYHDLAGLLNGRTSFVESVKNGVCNGQAKLTRTLIKDSFQVYPLKNFGAIQFSDHTFDILVHNTGERMKSVAKLTAVWRLSDGRWEVTRVMSYDHRLIPSR